MPALLFLTIIQPFERDGMPAGGLIVLGFVWEKIRPIILIRTDRGIKFYYGISHSKKRKNLKKLTQTGINGLNTDIETRYGLCNTPVEIIKEIGTISVAKAQEILNETDIQKITKIEKRGKNKQHLI